MKVPANTKLARKYVELAFRYARKYPSSANYGALSRYTMSENGRVKFFCRVVRQSIRNREISDILVYHKKHNLSFVIARNKIANFALSKFHGDRSLATAFLESQFKNVDAQFDEVTNVVKKFVKNNRGFKTEDDQDAASIMLKHQSKGDLAVIGRTLRAAIKLISENSV
ncbi:MAG TPA: hypothetical protein HA254_04835 [Candidatus Diapherotrites archaeon]|uniref:Uncharacterized protein n=1 Tax=Candidatus Iainarchaeum sp. TaxID=3101447 RepID=A0A7J4IYN7_9ARCH|nr:hypothetical protein [Candidatus Diapherotrites archaeon]